MRILYSFCFVFFLSIQNYAASYYWVGGSGIWSDYAHHWATSSGGTVFQSQVPTNLDDVYFDQNSGFTTVNSTVSVDQTIVYCRNMDWTGVSTYPIFQSTFSNNTLKIFGSLNLSLYMDFMFNTNISFEATTSGQTINCEGKTLPVLFVYFNGINGAWTFTDAFSTSGSIVHNAGTIITNNLPFSMSSYNASDSAVAGLDAGSSVFNITQNTFSTSGEPEPTWTIANPNLIFDGSNTVLNFLGNMPLAFSSNERNYNIINSGTGLFDFTCNTCNVNQLNFSGNGDIAGNSIFQQLTLAPGGIYDVTDTIKISDTGNLIANGTCSQPIFLECEAARKVTYTVYKNSGSLNVNYVYLQNARTSGTAIFNANNSYNIGNVTGWNISKPASKNLYWIGGTGKWSDPNHWSETSGGTVVSGCVPTYLDNVYFDQNSGLVANSDVSIDIYKVLCHNMDWSGITNKVNFYGGYQILTIGGSLTLSPNLVFQFTQMQVIFNSQVLGNTITSRGVSIPATIVWDGVGGEWTLMDSLNVVDVNFYNGSLISNNQNISLSTLNCYPDTINSVKINLQNSTVKVSGEVSAWYMSSPGVNFLCGTSTVILNNLKVEQQLYASAYQFYNLYSLGISSTISIVGARKLYFANNGTLEGSQTFDSLIFSPGGQYSLGYGVCTINKALVATSTCGNFITLAGFTSSTLTSTIYKATGAVSCSGLILSNVIATGGASFTATNSFALSNVTGWIVSAYIPRNLYWVGGAGNWSDINHWSLTSGGAAGQCVPNQYDNVFFNESSGFITGSAITVPSTISCDFHNMDWTGVNTMCTFSSNGNVNIYGSLILNPLLQSSINPVFFSSNQETIKSCNNTFLTVTFNGKGSWKLLDSLTVLSGITHTSGGLIANGHTINLGYSYNAQSVDSVTLDLRNSKMIIATGGFFALNPPFPFNFLIENSTVEFLNQDPIWNPAGIDYNPCCIFNEPTTGLHFGRVICTNNSTLFMVYGGAHTFTYFSALGGAKFSNSYTFDTLSLTPGRTYTFAGGTTQTINSLLDAIGQPGFPIEILSASVGTPVNFYKSSGIVCEEYLYLKDIHATGGAIFYAGANGANVADNTGWIFEACGSTTGIKQASATLEALVYPVPVNNDIHVFIPAAGAYSVKIYNGQSNVILNSSIEGNVEYTFNTSSYVPGAYYMSIDSDTAHNTYKIIVLH